MGNLEATRIVGTLGNNFGGMGLTIASGVEDIGTVTVLRHSGSGKAISVTSNAGINRSWDITITGTQPASGRNVIFSWPSDDDNSKDMSQMQIWSRQTTSDPWVVMTVTTDVSATRAITVNATHFSEWTASDIYTPLPVHLLSFSATRHTPEQVELVWGTAMEHNNQGFAIEKSADALHFQAVTFVKGKSNSNEELLYNFVDESAYKATYYRLKQMDGDGNFEYSAILHVPASTKSFLSIYPNPAVERVSIVADETWMTENEITLDMISGQGVILL